MTICRTRDVIVDMDFLFKSLLCVQYPCLHKQRKPQTHGLGMRQPAPVVSEQLYQSV